MNRINVVLFGTVSAINIQQNTDTRGIKYTPYLIMQIPEI